jgi:hypothetical protein
MKSVVTLKTNKSEKHWIYILEAYESGNSTEYVICFDDNEALRGIVIVGEWEFETFFRLASQVSQKLRNIPNKQKNIMVSLIHREAAPMRFKATQEGNMNLWKVVLSCVEPSQCWKTWKSGSGSPRNFILYLTWSEMGSMFDGLSEIPEINADEGGHIKHAGRLSWVEASEVNDLEALPKQIILSARKNFIQPEAWSFWQPI